MYLFILHLLAPLFLKRDLDPKAKFTEGVKICATVE